MGFKAIYPENQGTPTASSEDAAYPATNLTDNNKNKKVFKAASGINVTTLRLPVSADADEPADGCGLTNTNAESAIVAVTLDSAEVQLTDGQPAVDKGGGLASIPCGGHGLSQGDVALINGTTYYDGLHTLPSQALGDAANFIISATYIAETFSSTDTVCEVINSATYTLKTATRTYRQIWHEYTAQTAAHTVTIKLTAAAGTTVQAGIFRAGVMVTLLHNPSYGITKAPRDYSVVKEYADGSEYSRKRDIVREFNVTLRLTSEDALEDLYDLYAAYGPAPIMLLLVDGVNDLKWTVFGKIKGLSEAYQLNQWPSSFSVLEAV